MFAGVGERTREGNDLYHEMSEAGVINQKDLSKSKVALVYGQMNEPPGARLRVALSALSMAEYFRDEKNQDVLLFVDNVFRFSQAGSEVSALLGRTPSAVGYQPTLAAEMGQLQERITSTTKRLHHLRAGRLRSRGRPDRPRSREHLRALGLHHRARALASPSWASIPPSIRSPPTSKALAPDIVGEEHYAVARGVQHVLQRYKDLQDIIAILGMDELSPEDKLTRLPRPQNPALPLAALLRRRSLHRHARRSTSRSRKPSAASRKSSTANTTTCPKATST